MARCPLDDYQVLLLAKKHFVNVWKIKLFRTTLPKRSFAERMGLRRRRRLFKIADPYSNKSNLLFELKFTQASEGSRPDLFHRL
jgi:hypothetical protein